MDFNYTEEQQMVRDGVSKYLEKSYDFDARQKVVRGEEPWSREAWQQFAEFGLLALPFSEEKGGLGGSITDCVAVAELFGKHLSVEPFSASIMLAGAALAASDNEVAQSWLEKIISGEAVGAFAYEEGRGTARPDLIQTLCPYEGNGYVLSGEKRLVIAGADADWLVVVARTGEGLGLFQLDPKTPGVEMRGYTTIDGIAAANIRFNKVQLGEDALLLADAGEALDRILANAMIVQAAEAVGAMGALLNITGEYAATRKQFGLPIASFQSIAHRLADMKIAYTKALSTMTYTAALAESGAAGPREIATLKGQIGKLGREVGEAAIQTHGGVGMTDELNVSHYHKRLLALDAMFGGHEYHLRMLGLPQAA